MNELMTSQKHRLGNTVPVARFDSSVQFESLTAVRTVWYAIMHK